MSPIRLKRFAAMVLFVYDRSDEIGGKKICERLVYIIRSKSNESAYQCALDRGERDEYYFYDGDYRVDYRFLGIVELIDIDSEEEDVVWCTFEERLNPFARKDVFIPRKSDLRVFNDSDGKGKIKLLSD